MRCNSLVGRVTVPAKCCRQTNTLPFLHETTKDFCRLIGIVALFHEVRVRNMKISAVGPQ